MDLVNFSLLFIGRKDADYAIPNLPIKTKNSRLLK